MEAFYDYSIGISGVGGIENEANFLRVTHKYTTTVKDYMKNKEQNERESIERQVGRKVEDSETINVYEVDRVYEFVVKRSTIP